MIPGLNPQKCKQRNKIDAMRYEAEGVPLEFINLDVASDYDFGIKLLLDTNQEVVPTKVLGKLPKNDNEALKIINSNLPQGSENLELDDIHIHYAESANTNFIPDRFAFLDSNTTLKNLVDDAKKGVAFMNSHRTGNMSHPSELPYGRTFCAQYQEFKSADGKIFARTVIGFYMIAGTYPNGSGNPSTDDLSDSIKGGTLFDVSVGLFGATPVCDVDGYDLRDYERCKHIPGTTSSMSEDDIEAQKERGIPNGACSYTLRDGHLSELSGVYDGAVPGAGFRKFLKSHSKMDKYQLNLAFSAYANLIDDKDKDKFGESEMNFNNAYQVIRSAFSDVLLAYATRKEEFEILPEPISGGILQFGTSDTKLGEFDNTTGDPVQDIHLPPSQEDTAEEPITEEPLKDNSEVPKENAEEEEAPKEETPENDAETTSEDDSDSSSDGSDDAKDESSDAKIPKEEEAPKEEVAVESEPTEAELRVIALEAELKLVNQALQSKQKDAEKTKLELNTSEAELKYNELLTGGKILPNAKDFFVNSYLQNLIDDEKNPLDKGSRIKNFLNFFSSNPTIKLDDEKLNPSMKVLAPVEETPSDVMSDERKNKLIGMTSLGQDILKKK